MVSTLLLINRGPRETRIARLDQGELTEISIERDDEKSNVGHIYKGRVNRVVPGMQAAFVDIGLEKDGFLFAGNIFDPNTSKTPREAPVIDPDNGDLSGAKKEGADSEDEGTGFSKMDRNLPDISKLIRQGEEIMVQVIKEPLGTKGARLSGFLSIPGRYVVYLPNSDHLGMSRRIENEMERARLKEIIEEHRPAQGGFIVRTVAEGASSKNIKDDLEYIIKLWGVIKKGSEKNKAPSLVYSDLDLASRILRDRVADDVEKILVDDLEVFKTLQKFSGNFLPRFKKKIEIHIDSKIGLFEQYGIETEINRSLHRKVWLKSGGYIVIDENEALTTVDVNSGKFVGGRNLEDTILQTNLEAVKEIAYQLRLRNIGGIIVIDFIDMDKAQNRERIFNAFSEEVKRDPVKTNVLPISPLGLIEMTRKRTKESLRKQLMEPCPSCEGEGLINSKETVIGQIVRSCINESRGSSKNSLGLMLYCHPKIAAYLAEEARDAILAIEEATQKKISVKIDPNLDQNEYEIFAKDS